MHIVCAEPSQSFFGYSNNSSQHNFVFMLQAKLVQSNAPFSSCDCLHAQHIVTLFKRPSGGSKEPSVHLPTMIKAQTAINMFHFLFH